MIFALVVVGACVTGPVVAWWWGRRDPAAGVRAVRRRALSLGVVLGVVLWVPTLIDQLAGHPGNLSVLWAGTRSRGGSLGPALALRGYGAATAPVASWMHRLPTGGAAAFLSTFGTVFGAAAWAAGGLVRLALLGSLALATVDVRTVPNDLSIGGGTAAATIVRRSAGPAAAAAPRRPFVLALVDRDDRTRYAAYLGLGYALAARGLPVRLPPDIAVGIAARYGAARGMPTVTVGGDLRPTVDVTRP